MRRKQVLLTSIVLASTLLSLIAAPSSASATMPPTVNILQPANNSEVESVGKIEVSGQAAGWTKARDVISICNQSSECVWSGKEYDGDACPLYGEFRKNLYFNLPENSPNVGRIDRVSPTSATYSLKAPGKFRIWYSSVEFNYAIPWPEDSCKRTETFIDVEVKIPTFNASSPSFISDIGDTHFSLSEMLGCASSSASTQVAPGEKVTCGLKVTTEKFALGSVPITYFQQANGGKKVKVGTSVATIGEYLEKSFTIPKQKGGTVTFSAQITPLPATWTSLETMTVKSPGLPLSVRITGPSRVVRGKSFTLSFKSVPKISGTCTLTSYPEASGWGDLGPIRLVNGSASRSIKLFWPLRLGDGFTVGVSILCNVGARNSFNTFGAMGYLP